ncbi:hypothetical protein D3C81_2133810 [compost metagenome]
MKRMPSRSAIGRRSRWLETMALICMSISPFWWRYSRSDRQWSNLLTISSTRIGRALLCRLQSMSKRWATSVKPASSCAVSPLTPVL